MLERLIWCRFDYLIVMLDSSAGKRVMVFVLLFSVRRDQSGVCLNLEYSLMAASSMMAP